MKTIEEACNEFCEKRRVDSRGYPPKEWFKAGIAFAEEWISFEDEIPEVRETAYQVFVKMDIGEALYYGVETIVANSEYKSRFYTHWRPINRK